MPVELVGGAFLSASLQVLFDRLASREVLNLIQPKKLEQTSLDRLKRTLYAATAVVNDAEYKQISDPAVKNWMDDLRDAVYQADDLLDEISTKAVIQQQKVRNFFPQKIDDITQRLESIVQHKDILGLKGGERGNLWRPDQSTSLVEPSDVYGRDIDKETVINYLLDDTSNSNFSVIPIVGMGGIGKTTLAQIVYNHEWVKGKFHLRGWVCVSQEFDVSRITKSIVEGLTQEEKNTKSIIEGLTQEEKNKKSIIDAVTSKPCDSKNLNSLQLDLKEKLSRNKFLIVLDDVWNEDYDKWILLKKPFNYGAKGSKIILTTRSERVASIVQPIPKYHHHLNHLSEKDSWSLFEKHAFASMDLGVRSSLEQIGRDIVKKCQGLPLAIQAVGGLLQSEPIIKVWNIVLKIAMWNLPSSNIFSALRLSYHYLPPQLKQCFAYCSLFPKGHKFYKEELILLWMAEGLLESFKTEMTLEEVGSMYFDTLTSRSFFQRRHDCFTMHDLIHDLSILVAGEFYWRLEVEQDVNKIAKKTRHLSVEAPQATFVEASCRSVELESLRTLVRWSDPRLLWSPYIAKFKCLRALSFSKLINLNVLPDSIDQLIHLRYLDMSSTYIQSLPESLCKLYNLQTLKLCECRFLEQLPNNMQDLANLRYLDLSRCPLKGMPKGMCKLNNLQFLSDFVVGKDGAMMEELVALPNFCKKLEITCLEHDSSRKQALEAKRIDKKQLEELSLRWSSNSDEGTMDGSDIERDILDKLRPHPNLKSLTIACYRGTRFPDWLGDLSYINIVYLNLNGCKNCWTLPPLGQLSSLKTLLISNFDKVVRIRDEFYKADDLSMTPTPLNDDLSMKPTPFASLESLEFASMSGWQEWYCIEAAFPKLRVLRIWNCPKLEGCLLLQGKQEFGFGRLDCDAFGRLPSLQEIYIISCPNLRIEAVQRLATSVKELQVRYCPQLEVEELRRLHNVRFY